MTTAVTTVATLLSAVLSGAALCGGYMTVVRWLDGFNFDADQGSRPVPPPTRTGSLPTSPAAPVGTSLRGQGPA